MPPVPGLDPGPSRVLFRIENRRGRFAKAPSLLKVSADFSTYPAIMGGHNERSNHAASNWIGDRNFRLLVSWWSADSRKHGRAAKGSNDQFRSRPTSGRTHRRLSTTDRGARGTANDLLARGESRRRLGMGWRQRRALHSARCRHFVVDE